VVTMASALTSPAHMILFWRWIGWQPQSPAPAVQHLRQQGMQARTVPTTHCRRPWRSATMSTFWPATPIQPPTQDLGPTAVAKHASLPERPS
jgi:hypothetical protein